MKDAKKSEARTNAKAGTTPSSAGGIEQLVITTENYDPKDPTRRPEGWSAIRGKRVYRREQLDRLRGISDAVIKEKRPQKEQEEEQAMQKEVAQHGHLLGLGGGKSNSGTPVGVAGAGSGDIDGDGEVQMHFDPSDFDLTTNKRPKVPSALCVQILLYSLHTRYCIGMGHGETTSCICQRMEGLCVCGEFCGETIKGGYP